MKFSLWNNYRWGIREYDKVLGKGYHLTDALCIIVGAALPFIQMAFPSAVMGFLQSRRGMAEILFGVLFYVVALKAVDIFYRCMENKQRMNYFIARLDVGDLLVQHKLRMDYEKMESKEGKAKSQAGLECIFRGNDYGIEQFLKCVPVFLMNLLGCLIYSMVVFRISPWILLYLLATTVLLAALSIRQNRFLYCEDTVKQQEKFYQQRQQAFEESFLNEARNDMILYRAKDWMLGKLNRIIENFRYFNKKFYGYQRTYEISTAVLNFLRDCVVYLLLIRQMAAGKLTVSEFLLFVGAVAGFGAWVQQMANMVQTMVQQNRTMTDFRDFLSYGEMENIPEPAGFRKNKGKAHEIRLSDVCYRYENNERDILSHINLTIRSGEKLALVGANGAGKSTLVKLILGLYQPTSGKIYLDGVDIASIPREQYFSEIAAVFQETCIFAASIAQNVACQVKPDMARVMESLRSAGLAERVEKLPYGADTILTKNLSPEGVELSGGEYQKLMLARAIYQDAPFLVLDEPTAALDPIAESKMYEAYQEFCEEKTGIFISHRLSSTRFCDRVCFLKDGVIAEEGDHTSLLAAGGDYAEMFEIQARYYKEDFKEGAGNEA